jgi:3',5'-cyclic AMP phosphodiesterase CpdA
MRLFSADAWLKAPLDRDVIARWTVGPANSTHELSVPQPPNPSEFEFVAFGDTGDSESSSVIESPQDAVAKEIVRDCVLTEGNSNSLLVVHTGDVVYMTGERRLYERNFRRPYSALLTTESTVDNLTFRVPFLVVPGNHDYYDVGGWAKWLARVPLLRRGVNLAVDRLFAVNLPEGGSGMGAAFMTAFVDPKADTSKAPYPYTPGQQTRFPNRYYRFTFGSVDFFGLDSNTLEAPPPGTDEEKVRRDAASHVKELEEREEVLEKLLRRAQKAMEQWADANRDIVATDAAQQRKISRQDAEIATTLNRLHDSLEAYRGEAAASDGVRRAVDAASRRWSEARSDWESASDDDDRRKALDQLEESIADVCGAADSVAEWLGSVPNSPAKLEIQTVRDDLEQRITQRERNTLRTPPEREATLRKLSDDILDVQRDLALERRRARYRPEDYDHAQLEWLDRSLTESVRDRPGSWRVVFLHHPLYSTTKNHCEGADVVGLRSNMLDILKDRVHLVISGHAHAFEWLRSSLLPNTGLFVTGGGGHISLVSSLLGERRFGRRRARYESLRSSELVECTMSGDGPDAADGEDGGLYHYLRIQVTPEALVIRPVGVRRLAKGYRRECPMPTFHAPSLPPRRPEWRSRLLESVSIRKDRPPEAAWK